MTNLKATRDGFGDGLLEAAKNNSDIVVLSADLTESTRCLSFKQAFPQKFFECGVAEQNMIGLAAGLALSGKIPIVSSYAVFSPGINWSQIRTSICYQNLNVKMAGHHSGVSIGPDGATHQGIEDIALTRCLSNMIVLAPSDAIEAKKATIAALRHKGPVYIRLTKSATDPITQKQSPFKIGKAQILRAGEDLTLIGCGPILSEALKAAEALAKEKINIEVINCHTIKPIDQKTILASVKKTKCLITLEDHQIMGGLGSAVLESIAKDFPVPTYQMGINNLFGQSGKPLELWDHYQLTAPHIEKTVKKALGV
ncbi:MAG: transketolase C-terminal domain-containing protein [Candidatus Beckwithbacteria bacterium]